MPNIVHRWIAATPTCANIQPAAASIPTPDAEPDSNRSLIAQNLPALVPSSLGAKRLQIAYGYWLRKRQGRLMPSRLDIDPAEIPRLLPYVMLIDVVAEPLDFRYRLIGAAARKLMRRDFTGGLFSEIAGNGEGSVLRHGCKLVVRTKAPISMGPPHVGTDPGFEECENVLLPLSDDRVGVTTILTVISFKRVRRPKLTISQGKPVGGLPANENG
jgi:hypothetical protein